VPSSRVQMPRVPMPRWMASSSLPLSVLLLLLMTLVIYAYGIGLLLADKAAFLTWIREDGLAEWLTFVAAFAGFLYALWVRRGYGRTPANTAARRVWLVLALVCLFVALEEISYGQRVFGIPTPDFLRPDGTQGKDNFYNKQGEITIHNLVIYGVNINKLVFGLILTILVLLYLFVVPVLYRASARFKRFVDRWGIPVAQNYHIAVYVLVAVPVLLLTPRTDKVSELHEFAGCFIGLTILIHPLNPRRQQ
jgi:hypothetical protein